MSRADREPIKTEKPHYHSAKPSLPLSRRLNHYGAAVSLDTAFNNTSDNLDLLKQQSLKARKMAEALFDREISYKKLNEFILNS
jgi:hypothetical protein